MRLNLVLYLFGTAIGLSLSFFFLSLSRYPSHQHPSFRSHHDRDPVPPRRDVLRVAVIVGGTDEDRLTLLSKTLNNQRTTYFVKESRWPLETGFNIVQMSDRYPVKYQVLHYMCQHMTSTQWTVITVDQVYVQVDKLVSLLLPHSYDEPGYVAYTYEQTTRNVGYCRQASVEIVSHGLLSSLCKVMTSCNSSTECVEGGVRGACSTASPLPVC